jgi:hypothetical protein
MGFEDLIQILVALAVLFGLFGGGRKKQPSGEDRSRRARPSPQRPRHPGPGPTQPQVPPSRPVPQGGRPPPPARIEVKAPPQTIAEEVYRILSGELDVELERRREETLEAEGAGLEAERVEAVERARIEDLRPVEEITEVEAYSLETLEPAGEASHREFHRKYGVVPAPGPAPAPAARTAPAARAPGPPLVTRQRLALDVKSARQAMLWREILGPPKSLE